MTTVGTSLGSLVRTLPFEVQASLASVALSLIKLITHFTAKQTALPKQERNKRHKGAPWSRTHRSQETQAQDSSTTLLRKLGLGGVHDLFQEETWQPLQDWAQQALDPELTRKSVKRNDGKSKRSTERPYPR